MTASALNDVERQFLEELNARGVRYMLVGLTAAIIQGANTVTRDIDLWFESLSDPEIGKAADAVGGVWVSGFAMRPPQLGGSLGDRFDVVISMSGIGAFVEELATARTATIDGVVVNVLPLERILASKRAANRPKDRAAIPALEEAIAALEGADLEDPP